MRFINGTMENDPRVVPNHGRTIKGPGLILPNLPHQDRIAEALS